MSFSPKRGINMPMLPPTTERIVGPKPSKYRPHIGNKQTRKAQAEAVKAKFRAGETR
jgi:hypothetical protein